MLKIVQFRDRQLSVIISSDQSLSAVISHYQQWSVLSNMFSSYQQCHTSEKIREIPACENDEDNFFLYYRNYWYFIKRTRYENDKKCDIKFASWAVSNDQSLLAVISLVKHVNNCQQWSTMISHVNHVNHDNNCQQWSTMISQVTHSEKIFFKVLVTI